MSHFVSQCRPSYVFCQLGFLDGALVQELMDKVQAKAEVRKVMDVLLADIELDVMSEKAISWLKHADLMIHFLNGFASRFTLAHTLTYEEDDAVSSGRA